MPSASYEPLGGHGWTQSSGGRGGRGHMGDMPAFHPNRPTQPPTRSSIQTLPSLPVQSRTSPCLFMVLTYPSIKGSETTFPGSPLHALVLSPARSGSLQVSLPSAAEMPQGWATEARHAPCLNSHQCETPLPPHPRFSSAHSMFSPSPASTLKAAFFPNRSSREITLRRGAPLPSLPTEVGGEGTSKQCVHREGGSFPAQGSIPEMTPLLSRPLGGGGREGSRVRHSALGLHSQS